jgi:hypothetical protein
MVRLHTKRLRRYIAKSGLISLDYHCMANLRKHEDRVNKQIPETRNGAQKPPKRSGTRKAKRVGKF